MPATDTGGGLNEGLTLWLSAGTVLFLIENGISGRVVVHLHLPVNLHVFLSSLYILKKLRDSRGEVNILLKEDIELRPAACYVLRRGIGTLHLLTHVVYLQLEDAEAVDSPCGRLSVYGSVRKDVDIAVELAEVCVNLLDKVCAVDRKSTRLNSSHRL